MLKFSELFVSFCQFLYAKLCICIQLVLTVKMCHFTHTHTQIHIHTHTCRHKCTQTHTYRQTHSDNCIIYVYRPVEAIKENQSPVLVNILEISLSNMCLYSKLGTQQNKNRQTVISNMVENLMLQILSVVDNINRLVY